VKYYNSNFFSPMSASFVGFYLGIVGL